MEYDIEIAFFVWPSANRHALASKNYGILGFNDLPGRTQHFHALSIKMCGDNARNRECHGFVNPCGLMPRVPAGAGAGCEFVTLAQPVPMTRV